VASIVRAAQRIASGVDTLSATFARLLGRVMRETERSLPPLVKQAQQGSRTALVRAAQANATRQQLRAALKAAGYDVLAESAYGPSLDTLIRRVLS
jgi:phytoene/squalene synthetase